MLTALQTFADNNFLLLAIAVVLLGLVFGSFLNVVIYRLPIMLERDWREQCRTLFSADQAPGDEGRTPFNLIVPRSGCPHCGHRITAWENIPLLSFLWQKGRCTECGVAIPWRYPVVELLSALLAATVIWRLGLTLPGIAAVGLTWGLIALASIDIEHQLLPDPLTLPLLWAGLILNLFATFTSLQSAVIGAVAGYLFLWILFQSFRLLTGKEGMGYGDFKLYALFGAWLGWQQLPLLILLASLVGAIVGLGAIVLRGRERHLPIPFGPFLCAAGWIALLWGDDITRSYLRLARIGY